ncbi:TrmH family RNA methyltransferase [Peptoniphilus raoultii]|uniref:TrmH family RNA methyltransferase n=1 Tax=Peptoniphilus raoultii TaxID=1776387 RepID=UPI000B242BE3|nr:RNA methyltransferase [Peptoniphilus raoultii]
MLENILGARRKTNKDFCEIKVDFSTFFLYYKTMKEIINSKDNKYFKFFKKILIKKYRYRENLFLVEGSVVISEALKYCKPSYIVVEESKESEFSYILKKQKYLVFSDELFQKICDSESPQGICAYFPMIHKKFEEKEGQFLFLDDIKDAGNLGGIIRTCDAFGISGLIISENSCDLYNPKTVRSTMASIFRLPIYFASREEIILSTFKITSTSLNDAVDINEYKFSKNEIIVIGNEAHGVSQEILKRSDGKIKISIREGVDSLNAGVAAGICLFMMNGKEL